MSTIGQRARDINRETGRVIGEHPLPSALTAFGVGVGLGFLGAILLPDRSRQQEAAITKRVLDAVLNALPHSVAKHLS
jgi:hypothetical protein